MTTLTVRFIVSCFSICTFFAAACAAELYRYPVTLQNDLEKLLPVKYNYRIDVLYRRNFDPDGDAISNKFEFLLPHEKEGKQFDYMVVDWEGKHYKALRAELLDKDYSEYLPLTKDKSNTSPSVLYGDMLNGVREVVGTGKLGVYGIPERNFNSDAYLKAQPESSIYYFINQLDAFFPSAYLKNSAKGNNIESVVEHIEKSVLVGCKLGLPVYPFITHRYHPKSNRSKNALVPVEKFNEYIERLLEIEVSDCRLAGLIWWDSDLKKYTPGIAPKSMDRRGKVLITMDIESSGGVEKYYKNTTSKYALIIEELLMLYRPVKSKEK